MRITGSNQEAVTMVRSPRSSIDGLNKGAWTAAEDKILTDYIKIHGEGKWSNVAKETGTSSMNHHHFSICSFY